MASLFLHKLSNPKKHICMCEGKKSKKGFVPIALPSACKLDPKTTQCAAACTFTTKWCLASKALSAPVIQQNQGLAPRCMSTAA